MSLLSASSSRLRGLALPTAARPEDTTCEGMLVVRVGSDAALALSVTSRNGADLAHNRRRCQVSGSRDASGGSSRDWS